MTINQNRLSVISLAVLLASAALVTNTANAQSMTDLSNAPNSAAWYFGADIGRSAARIDDPKIRSALAADGATSTSLNDRDRSTAYKVVGGYQFNDYFAVEAAYFDLGKFGYHAVTVPQGQMDGEIRLRGFDLDLVGLLPVTDHLSIFGRVGIDDAKAKDEFSASGIASVNNANPSKTAVNLHYGLGLQYGVTSSTALRLEVERYRIDDAIGNRGDINVISVGFIYRFGEPGQMHAVAAPAAAPVMPVAAVVAPAVAQAPVAPPVAAPVKVSLSADSLFSFNKAELKPEGRQAIDEFTRALSGTQYDLITVTGHTDRIGNHAANLRLSALRAEHVKTYLVDVAGIPAGKIEARGVDGENPVTRPEDCPGQRVTKALIACLQPDRRVDLEVTATK